MPSTSSSISSCLPNSALSRAALLALAIAASGAAGCVPFGDPGGPGATGTISLADGTSTEGFSTLMLRAAPDSGFDPAAPVFPASSSEGGTWLSDGSGQDLASLAFPLDYEISESLGTTSQEGWRMFAWLSATPAGEAPDASAPASGEPYGTVSFKIDGCGQYGGYCGIVEGVDLTIDSVAP